MEALGEVRPRGLYNEDSWARARQQAEALRQRNFAAVDWENVIEEIEDLGLSQERVWASHCANVLSHMLKIRHSGAREACRHWVQEIRAWRNSMHDKHLESRGMRQKFPDLLAKGWRRGRRDALEDLPYEGDHPHGVRKQIRRALAARIPEKCPYELADVIGYDPQQRLKKLQKIVSKGAVWPPDVAETLNEELGEDCPIRYGSREPVRGWSR